MTKFRAEKHFMKGIISFFHRKALSLQKNSDEDPPPKRS